MERLTWLQFQLYIELLANDYEQTTMSQKQQKKTVKKLSQSR